MYMYNVKFNNSHPKPKIALIYVSILSDADPVPSKMLSYNRANRAVAILCNHQRAAPKTFDKQMSNLRTKIEAKEDSITETKGEIKALKREVKTTKDPKATK
jgi:DNA topoisomerase-1